MEGDRDKEDGLELGLGLRLGLGFGNVVGRRILTAKDFPNGLKYGRSPAAGSKRDRTPSPPSASLSPVVGWPPIRAYRLNNTLFNQAKPSDGKEDKETSDNEDNSNSKKKINHGSNKNVDIVPIKEKGYLGFVKVNMDGVPIGRKVDLNAHQGYETLANMLGEMFFKPSSITGSKKERIQPPKLLDGSSEFVLAYEDKEGDWMLLGDVPWGMFLDTVKRVRIMRTSEANGLGPKIQEIKSGEKPKRKPG